MTYSSDMPPTANTPSVSSARPRMTDIDFSKSPFVVIWESTRACPLACRHCRAEAVPSRSPDELTTSEAIDMLDRIREFGRVVFVFSGGDALQRPDIVELTRHAASIGLRVAMTPAATPRLTGELVTELRDAGLLRLAVSIDGATAATHDAFRRVDGSFAEALRALAVARAAGLGIQVNTVIGRHNVNEFDDLAGLMSSLGIVFWEVFFLVPVGRAQPRDVATAAEFEQTFHRLYDLSRHAPFDVKATAAPQYSRVILQRQRAERRAGERAEPADTLTGGVMFSMRDGIGRARSVNDGDGFMFISHTGDICPSGFLPLPAGNVRTDNLVRVYRESPLFLTLRDRRQLKGKCGRCEFVTVCGGSRARAWAVTGDYLAEEPYCLHEPRGMLRRQLPIE
jgi:radical SAM protein